MAIDKIGPVPTGVAAGAPPGEAPNILEWFTRVIARIQRSATTTLEGDVKQAAAVADLNQTISGPSVAEVQAISDKVDELLAAMRTAGQLDS